MTNYMEKAMEEAEKAFLEDEVPIGCVIVCNGEIVASEHNTKIKDNNSLAHAEMKALTLAQKKLGTKYLQDCEMFVTLEPCAMCAGAIVNARLGKLHYALREPKTGCCGSKFNLINGCFNHETEVVIGEKEEESKKLMQDFFQKKRGKQ